LIADGAPVHFCVLKDHGVGVAAKCNGARIIANRTPDRYGSIANIVLGQSGLDGDISDISLYLGAMIRLYANAEMSSLFKDVTNMMPLDSIAVDLGSG
jgi:hypothetical protein